MLFHNILRRRASGRTPHRDYNKSKARWPSPILPALRLDRMFVAGPGLSEVWLMPKAPPAPCIAALGVVREIREKGERSREGRAAYAGPRLPSLFSLLWSASAPPIPQYMAPAQGIKKVRPVRLEIRMWSAKAKLLPAVTAPPWPPVLAPAPPALHKSCAFALHIRISNRTGRKSVLDWV